MMVTPKPPIRKWDCWVPDPARVHRGRHTRSPHETSGAPWGGDGTRQREASGPREVPGSNPHDAGSVPQFPHLGLGILLPAAALPQKHRLQLSVASMRSSPIPPAPSCHQAPVPLGWELGSAPPHEHPPGSRSSPESPGLLWHPDQGHPATPGTGQPSSRPPQTPCEHGPGNFNRINNIPAGSPSAQPLSVEG